MKKGAKILVWLSLLLAIVVGVYYYTKFSYAEDHIYTGQAIQPSNVLKIGFLGDSWIVRQDLPKMVQEKLKAANVESEVIDAGHPGATTKDIYLDIFKKACEEYYAGKILAAEPQYCVIIAGTNDAAKHMGPQFYAVHMEKILKVLLQYNIRPIILKLPPVGLAKSDETKNVFAKFGNTFFDFFRTNGENYTLKEYRDALETKIAKNNMRKAIIIIDAQKILCNEYENCPKLFSDPLHLSKEGYILLSNAIVNAINSQPGK